MNRQSDPTGPTIPTGPTGPTDPTIPTGLPDNHFSFRPVHRPNRNDDEDELIKMQEAFNNTTTNARAAATVTRASAPTVLASGTATTSTALRAGVSTNSSPVDPATIVSVGGKKSVSWDNSNSDMMPDLEPLASTAASPASSKPKKKVSLFSQRLAAKQAASTFANSSADPDSVLHDRSHAEFKQDSNEMDDDAPKRRYPRPYIESSDSFFGGVLTHVSERTVDYDAGVDQTSFDQNTIYKSGFPVPVHRNVSAATRMKAMHISPGSSQLSDSSDAAIASTINHVQPDYAQDNIKKISMMSEEEIAESQREILDKLDPATIAFLKSRMLASTSTKVPEKPETSEDNDKSTEETFTTQTDDVHETLSVSILQGAIAPFSHIDAYIDPLTAQPEKLEWMLDLEEKDTASSDKAGKATTEKALFRFDFHGIIQDQSGKDTCSGELYHHGDEPSLPGYSIQELAHLSKSTVSTQRSLSLQILSRIIRNVYTEVYSQSNAAEICRLLKKQDILLHIRVAMDASHETVVFQAVETMAQYFGASSHLIDVDDSAEKVWERSSLARVGYRTVPLSAKSRALFAAKSFGKDTVDFDLPERDGSLVSIMKLLNIDAVCGLKETNFLVRMRYLLENTSAPTRFSIDLVDILTAIARHSAEFSQHILECAGLVDAISRKVLALKWPLSNTLTSELTLVRNTLRLFRVLCQSGRDSANSLITHNLIGSMMRYLTFLPLSPGGSADTLGINLKLDIAMQIWTLQGIVYTYALGGKMFDDYRPLIVESAEKCTTLFLCSQQERSSTGTILSSTTRTSSLAVLSSICRALMALLSRYRVEMNAGGENDALFPFVTLISSVLESIVSCSVPSTHTHQSYSDVIVEAGFISSALDFLRDYVSKSVTYQFQAKPETMSTLRVIKDWIPILAGHLLNTVTIGCLRKGLSSTCNYSTSPMKDLLGIPLCQISIIKHATQLTDMTVLCNAVAALIEMNQMVIKHLAPDTSLEDTFVLSTPCLEFVELMIGDADLHAFSNHNSWVRVFAHGRPNLMLTWTKTVAICFKKQTDHTPIVKRALGMTVVASTVGIPELLPGDEYIAADWLNGILLSHRFSPLAKPDIDLAHIFSLDLFSAESLLQSRALYLNDDRVVLRSLFFEPFDGAGSLPIRRDWIFSPLDRLYREFKTHGLSSVPADVIGIVKHVLGFVKDMSEYGGLVSLSPSLIVSHMMKVFLLTDGNGNEVFHDHHIAGILDWAFEKYASSTSVPLDSDNGLVVSGNGSYTLLAEPPLPPLEAAMCGGTAFFQLYQDLLDQFVAVSFGAVHFQKYLVLPLAMQYPRDYRMAFWATLDHSLLKRFHLSLASLQSVGICLECFTLPLESDMDMLGCYRSALSHLCEGSFLMDVATAHTRSRR
ncbi:hypothetical protein BASA83_012052 [Batrachochytrium salamandrivorans]|nr:hypothetical protein BASA83_012052 [Batrachochytrium salamandrivorans]